VTYMVTSRPALRRQILQQKIIPAARNATPPTAPTVAPAIVPGALCDGEVDF
jgi:hypothetical protein